MLFSAVLITAAGTDCTGGGPDFKVYAVKYGRSSFQKRFIFYGDTSGESVPFSWLFYCIVYGDKKILVDTGFNDPKMIKLFGIEDFKDPAAILKENGIDAGEITDVIITHSHFDHIGNAGIFTNARFVINRDELAALNASRMNSVKDFFRNNSKVTVFDESYTLYDVFNIRKAGGHSKGSSAVFFSRSKKDYCITGDEIYLPENAVTMTGNGSVTSRSANMKFIELLNRSGCRLFTLHDNRYYDSPERFIKVLP